ncbi:MAG TPA: hypothetical protein PK110_11970 [Niabella sp.]|nr:hypothetical protein [Niabella sp.]
MYADLIIEIYKTDPSASFEFIMKMSRNSTTIDLLSKLPEEIRAYIRQKSKERIKKYTGSHTIKTN